MPGATRSTYQLAGRDSASIAREEVEQAQEIWLSSSTKELAPIVSLDGKSVGDGKPGKKWAVAQSSSTNTALAPTNAPIYPH